MTFAADETAPLHGEDAADATASSPIVAAQSLAPAQAAADAPSERTVNGDATPTEVEVALNRYFLYFLLPLWFVPGIADWYWHRKTDIEHTSGTFESVTHALMMTAVGVPLTAVLLFEVNALVLVMMLAGLVVHEGITYWDVSYARHRRDVPTIEQHTHSFLEMLPFTATSVLICLKPQQFAAIFGRGDEPARWKLAPKKPPLGARYVATVLGAVFAFIALPYAEEFVRCYRVDRSLLPHPETDG